MLPLFLGIETMLVSHRKKFIFIKTAKTAGTSVESYFERFCLPPNTWSQVHFREAVDCDAGMIGARGGDAHKFKLRNHMSAHQIRQVVSQKVWDSYFKFSIIRNPFDLIVSQFFFNRNCIEKMPTALMDDSDIVRDFRRFAMTTKPMLHSQISIENTPVTDFLIKYEELIDGIKEVSCLLNCDIDISLLPRFKSEFRDRRFSLEKLYDEETISFVKEQHRVDLALGEYTFV